MLQDRTPSDHRAAVEHIMAAMPPNDSDVLPRAPRASAAPRHGALADQLGALLEWRRLEAVESDPPSSWCVADNDNAAPGDVDAEWEIRPTVDEAVAAHKACGDAGFKALRRRDQQGTPYGSDTESPDFRATAISALRYLLRYIAGTPVEAAEAHDPHFAPTGPGYCETPAQAALRALLEDAGVDASVSLKKARERWGLPEAANDNEAAFPYRPADPREIFWAGKVRVHPTSSRGGEFNDGISRRMMAEQERAHLRGKLSVENVKALDLALEAKSFAHVGEALGFSGKTAERHGKRLVLDACASLSAALKERAEHG